jgi:hypothetical protein
MNGNTPPDRVTTASRRLRSLLEGDQPAVAECSQFLEVFEAYASDVRPASAERLLADTVRLLYRLLGAARLSLPPSDWEGIRLDLARHLVEVEQLGRVA